MRGALLIIATGLSLLIAWDWNVFRRKPTAEKIMAVQPGMTMDEVRSLLGEPREEHKRGSSQFFCPCNPEKTCAATSSTMFTYTRKPSSRGLSMALPFNISYPMLWVHFNERGKLKEVFVKEYVGIEPRRVLHTVRLSPCDTTDLTIEHVQWAAAPAIALDQLKKHF
jgi:hypothetical protein